MKAAVVHSFSEPPQYADFADPIPGDGEELVTVTAAGLHPIVKALAAGRHYGSTGQLPLIPGVDGVGNLPDGRRIFFGAARALYGTMAERTLVGHNRYLPIPDAVDDVTAAAMMNPGMSSWAALAERAHFVSAESVLILGATGSAGQMAVQIARRFGARRIVAAGRDPEALEQTKALGADATISLHQEQDALVAAFREEIAGNRIDVVLDYVWGAPAEAVLAAIAKKGLDHASARIRYIQIGNSAGPNISLSAAVLRSSGLELLGSGFGSVNLERIFASMAAILQEAAHAPFKIAVTAAPLHDVESLWNAKSDARVVFQP
jgi:NADPH2:quinone reductase